MKFYKLNNKIATCCFTKLNLELICYFYTIFVFNVQFSDVLKNLYHQTSSFFTYKTIEQVDLFLLPMFVVFP